MKTLITGDIHGEFGRLNALINDKRPDLIICCGDFGYWPNVNWGTPLDKIKLKGAQLLFCDGNHEDHWALRDRESDELSPGITYMPRGSTYTLPDSRIMMFMGGGYSIDKEWRTVGVSWFPEETITQKDLMNLPDVKPDIFITHTCPKELLETMLEVNPYKPIDPSNDALSELWKMYHPGLWFFGHWHMYRTGMLDSTAWHCLGAVGHMTKWWMWLPD